MDAQTVMRFQDELLLAQEEERRAREAVVEIGRRCGVTSGIFSFVDYSVSFNLDRPNPVWFSTPAERMAAAITYNDPLHGDFVDALQRWALAFADLVEARANIRSVER